MKFDWGTYRHFPYERELALREASALIGPTVKLSAEGTVTADEGAIDAAKLLTYFSSIEVGNGRLPTIQAELERSASSRTRRQATRYSVHGLHEYRGKFNPQVCRALINILGIPQGGMLLDPYCGSGTTLVEAAHRGIRAVGTDLNPLAVFIANAKLKALNTPADTLEDALEQLLARESSASLDHADNSRHAYLSSWFEPSILEQIERLRAVINEEPESSSFFLTVASNLLRDFSLQEPSDLRIRRRATAGATVPFVDAFASAAREAIQRLAAAQRVVGTDLAVGQALLRDNRRLGADELSEKVDGAITSPPYATALPYIDTQRLSLIWLELLPPNQIARVEGDLTGSREMSTKSRNAAVAAVLENAAGLPEAEASFCRDLQSALTDLDGFRRQAVPCLLYRYFAQMAQTFKAVATTMKPRAPFALIVGHNHTTLSGQRFDINTPRHLASLAAENGWSVAEITPLQAYQRFGLHASNGVREETLLVLRAA